MKLLRTAAFCTALLAPACLETEEDIEVSPDGSVEVVMRVSGDLPDLSHGHPLPLGGPWQAADELTRTWVREVGPATGGTAVRDRIEAGAWAPHADPDQDRVTLRARARFDSVDELPSFHAPGEEPYRDAHLERSAELSVASKGARTVYTFERTYHARPFWPGLQGNDWVPEDVQQALDEQRRLTREQVARMHALLLDFLRSPAAMRPVTSSVAAIYEHGDASLAVGDHARVLERIDDALVEFLTVERIQALFDAVHLSATRDVPMGDEADLEGPLRDAARAAVDEALTEAGVETQVRNAVRERLEWNFTSLDAAQDLQDERFVVRISLPGTIVDGNHDRLEDGAAVFEFEGKQLFGHDRSMRVVSVLE